MAIHLIPFVAGTIVGGLVVYFYKDKQIRKSVKQTAGDVSDKVREAAGTVSHKVSEGVSDLRQKVSGKEAAAEEVSREKIAPETSTQAQSTAEADASGEVTKSD